ncbi:MAG: hypothetical protein HC925_00450 [Coleofasciculaceae cyanobacterium SM2_3_26]|nr:hypothetical protein [Coleofasciculaceae cyanobacterium SM2_3_26]
MRYRGVVLDADRLQVNLRTRLAIADGNIAYRSGQQLVRGERMRYNLVQDTGTIFQARGEVYLPTAGTDFAPVPVPTPSQTCNNP